nr:uncharacterized protein LOC129529528 [Gorilla gorilla gorilla]
MLIYTNAAWPLDYPICRSNEPASPAGDARAAGRSLGRELAPGTPSDCGVSLSVLLSGCPPRSLVVSVGAQALKNLLAAGPRAQERCQSAGASPEPREEGCNGSPIVDRDIRIPSPGSLKTSPEFGSWKEL